MNKTTFFQLGILCLFFSACHSPGKNALASGKTFKVALDTLNLFDAARNRVVPLAIYRPEGQKTDGRKLVIFSHGYAENQLGANMGYSYLTSHLAANGYVVASIQHELPTDSLLPRTGIPQIVRRSNWERGAANIMFVIKELKQLYPKLDYQHLALAGHSNGGDISMLFTTKYPDMVDKMISLDNRRVAFPRSKHPRIYSLRSSDQPADEGVLPDAAEQEKYGMKIIKLPNTIHNDMGNHGTEAQRKEIKDYVLEFLRN